MVPLFKDDYVEPTIWALRKNTRKIRESLSTLQDHLYGYAPVNTTDENGEFIQKGSSENPSLNILNSQTGFLVSELASDDPDSA